MKTTDMKTCLGIVLATAAITLIATGCGPHPSASAAGNKPGPLGMSPQDRQRMSAPASSGKAAHP